MTQWNNGSTNTGSNANDTSGSNQASGVNRADWTGGTFLSQEAYIKKNRYWKFTSLIISIVIGAWWLSTQMGAKPPAAQAATPEPVPTQVFIARIEPTATKVPPANLCWAIADGDGYAANSIVSVKGWSRAKNGQLSIDGIGWRSLSDFLCPGLARLAEIPYPVPTKSPSRTIVNRDPEITATPTAKIAPPPIPTPRATATPLAPFRVQCEQGTYVTNKTSSNILISSVGYPWSQELTPHRSVWINPNGAKEYTVILPDGSRQTRVTITPGCPGATIW